MSLVLNVKNDNDVKVVKPWLEAPLAADPDDVLLGEKSVIVVG